MMGCPSSVQQGAHYSGSLCVYEIFLGGGVYFYGCCSLYSWSWLRSVCCDLVCVADRRNCCVVYLFILGLLVFVRLS